MRIVRAMLALAAVAAFAALAPAVAGAKTTKNFDIKAKGTAVAPSATGDPNDPASHEDTPFTIAPDDSDGDISVHIEWTNPADDWDLYVFRKGPNNTLLTVGSSTGGAPGDEENAVTASQGIPITPGDYVIRVVNYAAVDASGWSGTAKFGPFTPPNQIPVAKLSAPSTAKAGSPVKLDASASSDPDGTIASYAFDLDGDGAIDVDNGKNPILTRVLPLGVNHIAVRVIDNGGLRGWANANVTVKKSTAKKHKKKKHKKKKHRKHKH